MFRALYYEGRILREDGSIWAGHVALTAKEALDAARAAAAKQGTAYKSIAVYECRLRTVQEA